MNNDYDGDDDNDVDDDGDGICVSQEFRLAIWKTVPLTDFRFIIHRYNDVEKETLCTIIFFAALKTHRIIQMGRNNVSVTPLQTWIPYTA